MTNNELEIVKLRSQILALETILSMLCSALGRSFPSFSQSFHETGKLLKEEHSKVLLKGYSPEMSDLLAGEYQDALDSLLKYIENNSNKK